MQPRLTVPFAFRDSVRHDVEATAKVPANVLLVKVKDQPHPLVLVLLFATPHFQDYQRLFDGVRPVKDDRTDMRLRSCA